MKRSRLIALLLLGGTLGSLVVLAMVGNPVRTPRVYKVTPEKVGCVPMHIWLPGTQVDVLCFEPGENNEPSVTNIIVSRVKVLAVDSSDELEASTTLLVTSSEARLLDDAARRSRLYVSFCRPEEPLLTKMRQWVGLERRESLGDELRREINLRNNQ